MKSITLLLLLMSLLGCSSHGTLLGHLSKPKPKYQHQYFMVDMLLKTAEQSLLLSVPVSCEPEQYYRGAWDTRWLTTPRIVDATTASGDYVIFYSIPCQYLVTNQVDEFCPSLVLAGADGKIETYKDKRSYSDSQNKYLRNCPLAATITDYKTITKKAFLTTMSEINQQFRGAERKELELLGQSYIKGSMSITF